MYGGGRGRVRGILRRRNEAVEPAADGIPGTDAEDGVSSRRRTSPRDGELLEHVAALRRYALLLVGDPDDADDLVQEALVRVLVRTRSWRPVRDPRAYLFTTLHNVFIDELRRKRHTPTKVDLEGVVDRLAVPAGQMDRLEWRDFVRALSRIPVEQREVVLLVGMEGLSYAEAAKVLGVPIGTVMSRLSRGREALRRLVHRAAPRPRVVDRS